MLKTVCIESVKRGVYSFHPILHAGMHSGTVFVLHFIALCWLNLIIIIKSVINQKWLLAASISYNIKELLSKLFRQPL